MNTGFRLMSVALFATLVVSAGGRESIELAVQGRANANASVAAAGPFVAVVWSATAGWTARTRHAR